MPDRVSVQSRCRSASELAAEVPVRTDSPSMRPATGQDTRQPRPASPATLLGRVRSLNRPVCADLEEELRGDNALPGTQSNIEQDPFEVQWDGDDDPLSPRSMPLARKWLIVIIVGMGSLCVTCASSIYTSTYGQMNPEFGISDIVGTLGLSTFVLGISLGPLLMSPLSEFYGRRPIYLVSWALFLVWLIPSAVAHSVATMLVARFIDGFAGSSFLSVAGGTISDVFKRDEIQTPMTIISLSPFIGPSLGPLLGGFINQFTSWRWTYYVLIIWAFCLLVMIFFFAPETYHPVRLRAKAQALREETGDNRWRAPMEKSTKSIPRTVARALVRPFQLLIFEPMCLLLCILSAILLGILYLFFGAFGLVFGENYNFELWQVGCSFLGILVGMVISSSSSPLWQHIRAKLVRDNGGISEPEFQLAPAVLGAVIAPLGLFWFAWTSFATIHCTSTVFLSRFSRVSDYDH
ncbi:major facilitator superfamily domain-containing protein [Xylariomycetidae sp. FL2044]|nr:major facilitator superfamily domain-containing protein [Xylariomycetidae sp. FL2044]